MDFGKIQVIVGPMFSGKTTELLRRIRRFELSKLTCLLINYKNNNRYTTNNEICTHDQCTAKAISTELLFDIIDTAKTADVIGIDEGQFFPDILLFCETLANIGKIVIVAGLSGDYRRCCFGDIMKLLPVAEEISSLSAICSYCNKEAAFSKRLTSDTTLELIGGKETYTAVCRRCYYAADNGFLK